MKTMISTTLLFTMLSSYGANITIKTRYQNVDTNKVKRSEVTTLLDLDSKENISTDAGIEKAITVSELGMFFKKTLKDAKSICKNRPRPMPRPRCITPRNSGEPSTPRCVPVDNTAFEKKCKELAAKLASSVVTKINSFNKATIMPHQVDAELASFIALGYKLAENIKEMKVQNYYPRPRMARGASARPARAASLSVTTGGAQSVEMFVKTIKDGFVPGEESFSIEGFMSHFDFPLKAKECKSVLCIQPVFKLDAKKKKLFVQLGMNTNVTAQSFKRKKLNLSVVLDISGSMSAEDGTEISRIEWAKKALLKTVEKMNDEDLLSIVLFNQDSTILLKPTSVMDKASIKKLVKSIEAGGSTNLEKGLRDGFNLVSESFKEGFENRVILISDAGANTGTTSEGDISKLVGNFATENIGLTAIGLGLNFKQELIHGITLSKGSNYVYVNSGKGLKSYFDQFDFLVSPLAYNFKASLEFSGANPKLVKAYGVPMKADSPVQDILDIRTLFLASEGGGTILLEYDIK